MRYIKPIRGFRFSRNLGLLLLSTAVFSGQFMVGNKAYGLEAPIMPPSFMMTSAKNVETESDVSSKAKVETKKEVKKEIKDAKVVVEKSKNASEKLADSPNQNNVIKKEVKNIPSEDKKDKDLQNSDNQKGLSTSELGLPEINLSNSEEDFSISKAEIKPEAKAEPKNEPKPEAKPAKNLIASAKIIEPENLSTPSSKDSGVKTASNPKESKVESSKESSEKKVLTKQAEKKEVVKEAKKEEVVKVKQEPVVNTKTSEVKKASAKNNEDLLVKKVEVKETPKVIEKSSNKNLSSEVAKPKKTTSRRRVVKEDNVCPPEWDWFSAPLVFVKDANGKMVIRADKTAPKIVIGNRNNTANNVKDIKSVDPKPVEVKKVVVKKTTKKQNKAEPVKYVEAKPIEAPASQSVTVEPKPVEQTDTEVKVVSEQKSVKPVVKICDYADDSNASKPLFAEAAEKMARIKRLHQIDNDNNHIAVSGAARSQSMVQMNKLVAELIEKSEKASSKKNEMIKAQITPQAPPVKYTSTENTANNNTSVNTSNYGHRYVFRPYVNYENSAFGHLNLRTVR